MKAGPQIRRPGKAAQRLFMLADGPSRIEDAVEIIASRLLEGIRCPPTDLDELMLRLGVHDCRPDDDLPFSGMLRNNRGQLEIVYTTEQSTPRRRFTIAHELAHAVFEATGPGCPRQGNEVERLCDMLAKEILLPRRTFLDNVTGEMNVEKIIALAELFQASLISTAIRCAELLGVSVFELSSDEIRWSYGIIRRGRLCNANGELTGALQKARRGESGRYEVILRSQAYTGVVDLSWKCLGADRSLFCLVPVSRPHSTHVRQRLA